MFYNLIYKKLTYCAIVHLRKTNWHGLADGTQIEKKKLREKVGNVITKIIPFYLVEWNNIYTVEMLKVLGSLNFWTADSYWLNVEC